MSTAHVVGLLRKKDVPPPTHGQSAEGENVETLVK